MPIDRDPADRSFRDTLRDESDRGPGHGLGRFARLVGSGAGLARKLLHAGRRGATEAAAPSPRDLRRMEALVRQLGDLKGLPMKFGQLASYLDVDLPEELRGLLALLQTQSPATPRAAVEATVLADLGARGAVLWAGLEPVPVSIASIGQVYRGHLPDGAEVAVKVRHPAIAEAIAGDFRVASFASGLAGAMVPGIGATARDFVGELRARILEECDYALEAERQRLFGRLYAEHPLVVVPRVFDDWCGPRVLTTAWQDGLDFETFRQRASQAERDRAGAALFDFYIGTLYRHGLFHADPHPGNYRFRADGRIVIFDYGCVRSFEPAVATAFAALAEAVRADDELAIRAALTALGAAPSANPHSYAQLRGLLRGFFGPLLTPGARRVEAHVVMQFGDVARNKLALARLRLPGRLVFLFRIRFGLFAVLARLGAVNDWAALERRLVTRPG